jgi:hypothetical protein
MFYIIDTNSLIHLKRNYSPKVFVNLWKNIEEMILNSELLSLKEASTQLFF